MSWCDVQESGASIVGDELLADMLQQMEVGKYSTAILL